MLGRVPLNSLMLFNLADSETERSQSQSHSNVQGAQNESTVQKTRTPPERKSIELQRAICRPPCSGILFFSSRETQQPRVI